MSNKRFLGISATVAAAGFLWTRAASSEGSLRAVFGYAIAGTLSGFLLTLIAREFAYVQFTRQTAVDSSGIGFLILTPLIAMLLDESADPSNSSSVVLAAAATGAAALSGAVWAVVKLAGQAFGEWTGQLSMPGKQLRSGRSQ